MGCKGEACPECTQKCLLLHRNNAESLPVITSFFKIMIGDQCDKILFLPPKFAPTVSELIDQKTFLEDSSGQQWEVTISSLNGPFGFHQGWNAFFLDHKLEVGDFVVFNCIVGSHFVVKIYGKTGCEKLVIPENRNKRKRAGRNENYIEEDGPFHTIDKSSMTKQGSSASVVSGSDLEVIQSQCVEEVIAKITSNGETSSQRHNSLSIVEYVEEPYYIIDRDLEDEQREDRFTMFDLSNFEMLTNNCDTDKSHKITVGDETYTHNVDASRGSEIEVALPNKDPVDQKVVNRVVPFDASVLELMEKNNDLQKMDEIVTVSDKISCDSKISEHPLLTTVVKPGKNGKSIFNISNGVVEKDHIGEEEGQAQPEIRKVFGSKRKCTSLTRSNQTAQPKFTGKLESDVPVTTGILNLQLGGCMKKVKKELIETTGKLCSDNKMIQGKVPQASEVDCCQSTDMIGREITIHPLVKFESLEAISCVIASDNEPFLVLPSCLPLLKFSTRYNSMGRVTVHLRDPYKRIWPVLYHERPRFKLLLGGWDAFSKANNIQAGDECIFEADDFLESTVEVNIV
ncbi:hypothetical protein Ddye_015541 [Dipteronia dyeriana]|uniref:TF-B3 domain-containing protein n=1 Tax=Dipteronia dyeriana TaxID=168575 RepID=A0AAD9U554_9ROSI|nr:hypothetical protein Ddye_015541 [Dipteronia dyeriana]